MKKTYRVHTAPRQEINEGWVWIKATRLRGKLENRRAVVCITHRDKSVFCEAIYATDRDLEHFTGTFNPPVNLQEDDQLFISAWYRHKLDLDFGPTELAIETAGIPYSLWWQFLACIHHPQVVVFLAAVLGMVGLGLGTAGVGLGLIGLTEWGPVAHRIGWTVFVAGILVVFVFGLAYPLAKRGA